MRWVKASERLPDKPPPPYQRGKLYVIKWRCPTQPKENWKDWMACIEDYWWIKEVTDPNRTHLTEVEWLDESDGSDREMGEFAEWISKEGWRRIGNVGNWTQFKGKWGLHSKTITELVKLFRQSKNKLKP